MFDGSSWFRPTARTPTLGDLEHRPFLRRHLWPPSAMGVVVISVVLSALVGFTGALVYTSSDNAQIEAVDPADEARVAPTIPGSGENGVATTKPPEILTPEAIAKKAAPSVWSVSTLDDAGRPVEGSGFIAGSFGGQTFLLTSFSIVRAAARIPGPEVVVRNEGAESKATLWTWQEDRDLALLVIGRTAPSLSWADDDPQAKAGDKVYLVPGTGGGPLPGTISSVSPASIQHNVFVDDRRQGAALLNEKGQVLGMASLSFNLNAPTTDTAFYAVPISASCERVLSCGNGTAGVPSSTVVPAASTTTTR
jgi:S1-C subfamily serine protease